MLFDSNVMLKLGFCLFTYLIQAMCLVKHIDCAIYTYEDVELRRIFPSEFPQDTVRKSGILEPEHLGRYFELKRYFKYPKSKLNSHFEELNCYNENGEKVCKVDVSRYSPDEEHYMSSDLTNHVDRRRVYCLMLLCFTEDELDRVVASF
ncbi:uncharacterized protein LOC126768309 isoform X1 [Nymphalis io]|uniref:uncharacterized protein LOC126768309 isoform X1 n=1 Tax=Inachis io TaxID=171585 RepID=UPI00216887A1|nr:uncharacterized protein LOC126768309 isoform X1 [Nymphalis io]